MVEKVFEGIRNSVMRRQNTIVQYIATRPILDLCERSTWRLEARVARRWWEQAGIDLEGANKRAAAAEAATDSELNLDSGREESSGASGLRGAEWSGAEW